MSDYTKQLERNLYRYAWVKTFTKRVYFPILTIMQVTVAGLSYDQIALIGIIAMLVNGILQMPSGYLADKVGNKKVASLGALVILPSTLFYIFMPNFYGSLFGLVFYVAGMAFITGATESLIHDSLVALGRAKEYTKAVGRAQSFGLFGNVVLVTITPLTYAIDYRLPFVIGFFASIGLLYAMVKMASPRKEAAKETVNPIDAMSKIITWQNVSVFVLVGFVSGMMDKSTDFSTLLLAGAGIPEKYFGVVVAVSSLLGALLGWYLAIFDKLKPLAFYLFDLAFVSLSFVGIGLTKDPVIVVSVFVLFMAYFRVRNLVLQSKLLEDIQHTYKATLISTLGFVGLFGGIINLSLITSMINRFGLFEGHVNFGYVAVIIGLALWLLVVITAKWRNKVAHRSKT